MYIMAAVSKRNIIQRGRELKDCTFPFMTILERPENMDIKNKTIIQFTPENLNCSELNYGIRTVCIR